MLGYFLFFVIAAIVAIILFSPLFKGWRTHIFNTAFAVVGAAIPALTEWVDFLRVLDWRTYLLANDKRNMAVVGVVAGLALIGIILRQLTNTPIGKK